MLHSASFVAYECNNDQNFVLVFKLFTNDFSKAAQIKLDCSCDRSMSNSQIQLNIMINYYDVLKISRIYKLQIPQLF